MVDPATSHATKGYHSACCRLVARPNAGPDPVGVGIDERTRDSNEPLRRPALTAERVSEAED
jgi:hypothetical protein